MNGCMLVYLCVFFRIHKSKPKMRDECHREPALTLQVICASSKWVEQAWKDVVRSDTQFKRSSAKARINYPVHNSACWML